MIDIDKILLPTDFSSSSRRALDYALLFAEHLGAELDVYHAVVLHADDPAAPAELVSLRDQVEEAMLEVASSRLAEWLPEERRRGLEVREVRERGFSAAPMILEYAARADADLIVMGTHGRRGAAHLFLGSVAEHVVRHAVCPVLTVHEAAPEQPLEAFERILVPVDLSRHSELAVSHGKELARLYGASLDLLHVIHVTTYPVFYGLEQGKRTDELKQRCLDTMGTLMKRAPGPEVDYETHVLSGAPAATITSFAAETGADLLILPTQGLSGLERVLMGSVAERVVRQAACPVLTIPPSGRSLLA